MKLLAGLFIVGLLAVPATADAAFVTANDTSVRTYEASPWSKGTLFKGEGFQVGTVTPSGWAYGRAKGQANRCGWVLVSSINSTTQTDTTCGAPAVEPLGDSEHVPGGGPSQTWYVVCASASLHGNYGGPGQLRQPTHTVTFGKAVGGRYTTGDRYAASIDGPTGTPRFAPALLHLANPTGSGYAASRYRRRLRADRPSAVDRPRRGCAIRSARQGRRG